MTSTAAKAHELIDQIPADRLPALVGIMEMLVPAQDSSKTGIAYEDELISDEENAQAASAKGPWFAMEDIMSEMGITQADLDRVGQPAAAASKADSH